MMPALVVEMLSAVNQMKTEPKQEALTLIEAEREFGKVARAFEAYVAKS